MEAAKVQHVTKASSDELLNKFADSGDEAPAKKELMMTVSKRRRRSTGRRRTREVENCESSSNCSSNSLVERKSLLPPAPTTNRKSAALLRQLGIGRSNFRARNFKNKSILGTIEKTWRKTVEGASKVFIEKHYNRHKRLINDAV